GVQLGAVTGPSGHLHLRKWQTLCQSRLTLALMTSKSAGQMLMPRRSVTRVTSSPTAYHEKWMAFAHGQRQPGREPLRRRAGCQSGPGARLARARAPGAQKKEQGAQSAENEVEK